MGATRVDIIDKLRIEAQKEPNEPIWREAIAEIQTLRVRVEALDLLRKMQPLPTEEERK